MEKEILNYNVIFQKEDEGGFSAWVPTLPGCTSQGKTFEVTIDNIKEAIILYLEDNNSFANTLLNSPKPNKILRSTYNKYKKNVIAV